MPNDNKIATPEPAAAQDAGAMLMAAGGLAAAFGAASCCALPVLLGSVGLGGAWLAAVGWVAAPHRIAFLAVGAACLAGAGGLLMWRRRAAAACSIGLGCGPSVTTALTTGILSIGALLLVLGFAYA